jgi:DNA-binding transcriptional regulator YdaS (Cro superfamily)
MNAQPIAHVYEMPRRKFRVAPGFVWTGNRASLAQALGVDISFLEACERGEEKAPASLAKIVRDLTSGAVELEVRKPGRPPKKLEHPLAQWIDLNRGGDRAAFAGEIGVSETYLRAVLSGRESLSLQRAQEIRRITRISLDELFPEQEPNGR